MDPAIRTGLAIFAGVAIKNILFAWWARYQERKALEPVPLRLRRGVYVPWGPVQRIRLWLNRGFALWVAYMAIVLVLFAAFKAGLWAGL